MDFKSKRYPLRYSGMRFFWILLFILFGRMLWSQQVDSSFRTILNGQELDVLVKDGDTSIIADLDPAVIKPLYDADNLSERERFLRYKRYAPIVYPYAVQAVRMYIQLQKATEGQTEKEKRKLVKSISQTLEDQFEKPLKNFTRTQGFLLTKMIERQLDKPFYDIIKELKGGFSAFYWNQLGKFNGFKLKDQYKFGEDEMLDAILEEYDLSKDLDNEEK